MTDPVLGLVVRYGYLWAREREAGQVEGRNDRPVVLVAVRPRADHTVRVGVAPITHSAPGESDADAVPLPPATKRRLGLDENRSWVIASKINWFVWPGHDLRRTPDGRESCGRLAGTLLGAVIDRLTARADRGRLERVARDD